MTTTFCGPSLEGQAGIGALTLGGFLTEVVERFGPNEALVFDDPLRGGETVRWTYEDLGREAHRVALGLLENGDGEGAATGILMGNRPEAVAALFGVALAGGVAVLLSTFAPKPELAHMVERAGIRTVLTQDRLLKRSFTSDLDDLRDGTSGPTYVVSVGTDSWDSFLSGRVLHASAVERVASSVTPDDDGVVIFSSGTTSAPKGMVHAHRAATLQFWVQSQIFGRHEQTRMWSSLPMFWTAGLNTAMGSTLAAGGCWVVQETFEPGEALRLMARERVTEPYTLPHQTGALEEHPDWAATDLSSLTCVYGKSAFARHPKVHGDTTWRMPVGYGLSETCAFFCAHWWSASRDEMARSMGRLLPGNELRVVDSDTGRALGAGDTGELAIKGPTLMKRYLGVAVEDTFDADGFFRTGDAGSVDGDGFVHWEGRRTEMIKTGGANVSPAELEVQLRACAPVKLARVVGIPDPRLDQLVVACITLKEGAEATEANIQGFLRERVASYKVPKRVLFFDDGEIPMTTSDTKVRDDALVALVEQRLATDPRQPSVHSTAGDR
ncbi:MAG: class I adenylate-forming enzyme family protein [Acidimicrobiales bacterium]